MTDSSKLEIIIGRLRQKSLTKICLPRPGTTGSGDMRECITCHTSLPLTDFWSAGRKQRTKECKWCKRAEAKRLYAENGDAVREKLRKFQRKKRFENPRAEMIKKARQRAARTGVDFSITEQDLNWPENCPVLGVKLIYGAVGAGRALSNSASLDRIDNSLGYVPGNVAIISNRANCIKRDSTLEELKLIVSYVEDRLNVKRKTSSVA